MIQDFELYLCKGQMAYIQHEPNAFQAVKEGAVCKECYGLIPKETLRVELESKLS